MALQTTEKGTRVEVHNSERFQMKDIPDLYESVNAEITMDAARFLDRYKSRINWKKIGDRSIDFGCAGGGTTSVLEKHLPSNYECLIGCDVNEQAIEYANRKFGTARHRFQVLDMTGDMPEDWRGRFDHVFSFYTLQWVNDSKQEKAFQNIYDLLVEDGDCLLTFLAHHPVYTMYRALAKFERWSAYLETLEQWVSPYYDCEEPDEKVFEMMKNLGFKYIEAKCKQLICTYKSVEMFKKIVNSINPFNIPDELMPQFLDDAEQVLRELRLVHRNENGDDFMVSPYNLMVVYGRKS